MSALETLREQEQALVERYDDLVARSIEHAAQGWHVPVAMLEAIAKLETQLGALLTLQGYAPDESEEGADGNGE